MAWVYAWMKGFALTCAIEIPIATILLRRTGEPIARRVILSWFAQLASHPAVWFVFSALLDKLPYPAYVAVAEAWAFGIEIVFYAFAFPKLGWKWAAVTSVAANAVSFGVGLLVARWLY